MWKRSRENADGRTQTRRLNEKTRSPVRFTRSSTGTDRVPGAGAGEGWRVIVNVINLSGGRAYSGDADRQRAHTGRPDGVAGRRRVHAARPREFRPRFRSGRARRRRGRTTFPVSATRLHYTRSPRRPSTETTSGVTTNRGYIKKT